MKKNNTSTADFFSEFFSANKFFCAKCKSRKLLHFFQQLENVRQYFLAPKFYSFILFTFEKYLRVCDYNEKEIYILF